MLPDGKRSFFSDLCVEILPSGQHYRLTKNFYVRHGGKLYLIPKGFVTDFASVPRALWSIFPPFGRYSKAAVFHDWLYREDIMDRDKADKAFLDCMEHLRVPPSQRWAMYAGLRLGGWKAWNHYRVNQEVGRE